MAAFAGGHGCDFVQRPGTAKSKERCPFGTDLRKESTMKRMLVAIAVLGASSMEAEIDFHLDRSQWETLKALGAPDPCRWRVDGLAIQKLVAAKLAEIQGGRPAITSEGRKAIVRGAPRLWDASG
jgi:hypothetical protein